MIKMKICRDNKACETWFGADGSFICRHGLVAKGDNYTAVSYNKCPSDLLYEYELEKWKDIDEVLEKLRLKFEIKP